MAGGDDLARERGHSEQTSREIDEEIRRIINESLEKVRHILETRRKALEALAERLIEKEVIDTAELKEIIERSSPSPMIVPGTGDTQKRTFVEVEVVPERKREDKGMMKRNDEPMSLARRRGASNSLRMSKRSLGRANGCSYRTRKHKRKEILAGNPSS